MKNLPKNMKPSALIRLAVNDLSKVERDKKRYKVNMSEWHKPNSHCSVCFAGSVIAKSLGIGPRDQASPNGLYGKPENSWGSPELVAEFNAATQHKLFALNEFREGNTAGGLSHMGVCYLDRYNLGLPESVRVPKYTPKNSTKFKAAMRSLATTLKRAGL